MKRPSIPANSPLHRLPVAVDTLSYIVLPAIAGIKRARADRVAGESTAVTLQRIARNTAVPVALGVATVGGCLALELAGIGRGPVMNLAWLNQFDLIQLGAGAVHGLATGAIEGFKPEALGRPQAEGSKSHRAVKAAFRQTRNNLLGDAAQMAIFKGLGVGMPPR